MLGLHIHVTTYFPFTGIFHCITLVSSGLKPSGLNIRSMDDYGLGDDKVCQA